MWNLAPAAKPRGPPALPPSARMINPTSNEKPRGGLQLMEPGRRGSLGLWGLRSYCNAREFRVLGLLSVTLPGRQMPQLSGGLSTHSALGGGGEGRPRLSLIRGCGIYVRADTPRPTPAGSGRRSGRCCLMRDVKPPPTFIVFKNKQIKQLSFSGLGAGSTEEVPGAEPEWGRKHRPTCPRRWAGPFPLGFNSSSSQVKPLPGSPGFPPGHLGEELLGSPAPENLSWRHVKDVFSTCPRKREDLKSRWASPEIQIIDQGLAHSGLPKDSC